MAGRAKWTSRRFRLRQELEAAGFVALDAADRIDGQVFTVLMQHLRADVRIEPTMPVPGRHQVWLSRRLYRAMLVLDRKHRADMHAAEKAKLPTNPVIMRQIEELAAYLRDVPATAQAADLAAYLLEQGGP